MAEAKLFENKDAFVSTVSSTSFQQVRSYKVPDNSITHFEFRFFCRSTDGTKRASFVRSGLFYRQGGNVQIQGSNWHTKETIKSDAGIDVGFSLGATDINLQVKNSVSTDHVWCVRVTINTVQ